MGCPTKDRGADRADKTAISFPGTFDDATPWRFYNHLIAQIPDDITVTDYCLGTHWSYVEATCGTGVSYTCKGGARRTYTEDFRGTSLRACAELAKSWCFEEASLGVAALNAWYSRKELLDPLGAVYDEACDLPGGSKRKMDAFEFYRPRTKGNKVAVIGHFPNVADIAEYADLTVLERSCSDAIDTPDPACEYILPHTDFAFITGVTIINKTAPRLLDLTARATTVMVGPSVVASPFLFDWGVETIAGSVVADPEKVHFAVTSGAGRLFGEALQMMTLSRKNPATT